MLFHRIHSPLVTCFSSSFNLFQFQVLRPFYGVLLKHGSNIMNPGHFVLCLGGEPHNSTTLQHRLHVLRNWNWSSCRGLERPCTAHQVCWEAPEILGNCSCGAVSSVKTMASVSSCACNCESLQDAVLQIFSFPIAASMSKNFCLFT